jgi:hypothetical protein
MYGGHMPRRFQYQPKRYAARKIPREQTSTGYISIQEILTILGGVTGVIIAILWVAGRFYAAGYFGAMNIPAFQINFSIWEYAELSWLKLIFFFLKKIYLPLVILAGISLVPLLAFILQGIFPKLKIFDTVKNIVSQIRRLSGIGYVLAFSIIIYFSYLLLLSFIDINRTGQVEGKNIVLTSSYAVEVFSRDFLPIGTAKVLSNTAPTLMQYSGLRLLTFNNGKYYLFRDLDPVTCKPSQVFIIPDTPEIHITLSAIVPIDVPCTITPTPTPVQ